MRLIAHLCVAMISVALFAGKVSAATPIGYIDQVVRENNKWVVKGWACQPSLGSVIQVRLFVDNVQSGNTVYTNQTAETAVHNACGTSSSLGPPYRFALPYTGATLSNQALRVQALGPGGTSNLGGSNEFRLPRNSQTPDAVLSASHRILLLIAHQDDEIVFAPFIKLYCGIYGKTCKIVTATNDPVRAQEWPVSVAKFPAQSDLGGFSSSTSPLDRPSLILQRWNTEAAAIGLIDLNGVIAREINIFSPDVILTFDPRHGTSCHPEHRAVGEAVRQGVLAYTGTAFSDKSKLFFLTTRRIDGVADNGISYTGLAPIAPKDNSSTVYSAYDFVSWGVTGWQFAKTLMETYPSQFSSTASSGILSTPPLERTTAFQRVTDYFATDTRYTNAVVNYPRMFNCPSF